MLNRLDNEWLRVLANVSVVLAHCCNPWVVYFSRDPSLIGINSMAAVLDQFTRFTVPLFLFLSGFGLAIIQMGTPQTLRDIYRKRIVKIGLPFLVWTAITSFRHIEYIAAMDWPGRPWGSLGHLLDFIFIRGFDYQYYFLILIVQFYLLFPLAYRLGTSRAFFVISLVAQMVVMQPSGQILGFLGLALPAVNSHLILNYWFYAFAGIFVARNSAALERLLSKWSLQTAAIVWCLTFGLINAEFFGNIYRGIPLGMVDHFNRWSVLLYCAACLGLIMKLRPALNRLFHTNLMTGFLYTHIAPYTFFVFFFHTHLLRVVDHFFWEITFYDMLQRSIFVLAGSYGTAWLTQWLLEDYPRIRAGLGLPSRARVSLSLTPGRLVYRRFALLFRRESARIKGNE